MKNFNNGLHVGSLIDFVKEEKLSILNAKEIAFRMIDGDIRSPLEIAEEL